MKNFKDLRESRLNEGSPSEYKPTSEPSKFKKGAHRAKLMNPQGKTSYVSQAHYASPAKAKAAADHYRKNMYRPTQAIDRIMRDHEKKHAMESVEEGYASAAQRKAVWAARNDEKEKNKKEDSDAVKAFLAKGGKIKKLPPGKAQGYHGKDDPGKDVRGVMDKPDTKAIGTRKKVKSMAKEDDDTARMYKDNPDMMKKGGPGGYKGLNKAGKKATKKAMQKEVNERSAERTAAIDKARGGIAGRQHGGTPGVARQMGAKPDHQGRGLKKTDGKFAQHGQDKSKDGKIAGYALDKKDKAKDPKVKVSKGLADLRRKHGKIN